MRIAIAGYGLEGRASYDYWNKSGNELVVVDERSEITALPQGADTILGADSFSQLAEFDLIVRSPSVSPSKLPYGLKVWSATNEFFANCPAPIIGVTGTKGKGTTSSFIAAILKTAGYTVHLVGNIGTPALAELPNIQAKDIVVFELSSFQLWDLQKSPHVAVVLGIEPDHLDIHAGMDDYIAAKTNIALHQSVTDRVVFNKTNKFATTIAAASSAVLCEYPFDMSSFRDAVMIPGEHNIENASAAVAAVREYVSDIEVIKKGLRSFTGLPHRIKFIREVSKIKYYDDSYSSAPTASLAALRSFTAPRVILLGGVEKGADFTELASYIAANKSVQAVMYGAVGGRIADELVVNGVSKDRITLLATTDFTEIVFTARRLAQSGSVVLLSPGCASFDMFRNFTDRGEQFIRIIEAM